MSSHKNPAFRRAAAVALGVSGLLALSACDRDERPAADQIIEPVEDAVDDLGDAANEVIDEIDDATSP